MGVQGLALLALLCAAGTEPRNASHALVAGRRRLNDQYAQIAKLTAADGAAGDFLGRSVAIDGDTIVVGADEWNNGGKGAVYVFRTSNSGATYDEVAKLTASDAAANDNFGRSVAIDGNTIVVGAIRDDHTDQNSGSVYVFHTSDGGATYGQVAKLTADGPTPMALRTTGSADPWPSTATPSWLGPYTRKPPTSSARPTAAPRTVR